MLQLFAHAGETHTSVTETSAHYLQEWYIALPLFVLVVAGFAGIVYIISRRSKPATYLSVVGLLLVAGVFMYDKSAIISISALAIGMAMILISVLASLLAPSHSKK